MIAPTCDKCGVELQEFGAIVLSPPATSADGSCGREVEKYHLCPGCWREFKRGLDPQSPAAERSDSSEHRF
jgi:hypothetical protein